MATIAITIPDDQVARVRAAFGPLAGHNDATPASVADVKSVIANYIKQTVRRHERIKAAQQADTGITDVEAT